MTDLRSLSTEELNAFFAKTCEAHQKGEFEKARDGYRQLLAVFPDAPMLHTNLGLLLLDAGRLQEAKEAFVSVLQLAPDDVDNIFNLAYVQKKRGDLDGAIVTYRRLLELKEDHLDGWYNLAGCLREIRRLDEAVRAYLEVLQRQPDYIGAISNLAYTYHLLDDADNAVHYYREVLRFRPEHPGARHMVAALCGEQLSQPTDDYVRDVFDNYAHKYDQSLVEELEYRVPEKLLSLLVSVKGDAHFPSGLDLGCGTGLSGAVFGQLVANFDGIDLSAKMISLAEQRKIYHELHTGSITDYLASGAKRYDFFLACDVFVYMGDLQEVMQLLWLQGKGEAILCFSTETLAGEGFGLQKSGRFAHAPLYITQLAEKCGWRLLAHRADNLRRDRQSWIAGDLWCFGRRE